jgi:hypothetical protein
MMTPLKRSLRRSLGSPWTDLLVVAACCLAFAAVIGIAKRTAPQHPATGGIVRDLGPTPEPFARVALLAPSDLPLQ